MFRSVVERTDTHEGVERLQMANAIAGRPLKWVSVYRVGETLIDSGCAWGRPVLERYVKHHPISTVLTTHEHEDHVGNHEVLQARMFAPKRAVELLREGPPALPAYRWIAWGSHGAAPQIEALEATARTESGTFEVAATPGHSSDHVVFLHQETQGVFSGDAFLGRLKACRLKENIPQQMASIRRLAALDPAALYPAHGPVLERPRARLLEVADHFDTLGEKARRLAGRGWSPRRIRQELMGNEPTITYASLGAFSAEHIILSLLRDPTDSAVDPGESGDSSHPAGPHAP